MIKNLKCISGLSDIPKAVALFILFFTVTLGFSQSLPLDFENSISTSDFKNFDGGIATVLANPQSNGINTSATVGQIVRNCGKIWSGSLIQLTSNLNFTNSNCISMKVFTTAPVGTTVKLKLEGNGQADRDIQTTVSNEWETLTWDFTGEPAHFNWLVFMFDFGKVGDSSVNSTFLFDDIKQFYKKPPNTQISSPVDFGGGIVEYATVYTTAKDSDKRLSLDAKKMFKNASQPLETEVVIFINPKKQFQEFLGIGGAITDASAEVFSKLSKDKQEELLKAYFSEEGINYNIIRTSIHSSDFGLGSHTYIEEGDKKLKTFSIVKDKVKRIPMIKRAQALINEDLVFYASPWSPPAFMKTNNQMLQGGKLLPEYYQTWADYFVKFIEAYEAEGIPVWGVTIQNEPMATQRWESCIYTAEEERDFLKYYLGPTFEKNGIGDKNIVVWDHNRDLISHRANTIFEDPEAMKYAWGIGFHWYETWTGGEPKYDNLKNIKESFPSKNLLFTEGCQEKFDSTQYQRWSNAEGYGNSMINDFNSGTVGWTDWNILLNELGGPNHVQNFCFAPIHADTQKNELIYTPTYYYIGHFSKFIKPKAKRISTTVSRSTLESTSFQNPDGQIVTVVMNKTEKPIHYKLLVGDYEITNNILPHAMQTIIF